MKATKRTTRSQIRASRLEIPGIRDRPSGFDEQKDGDAGIVACTEDGCK
jgi:hypothetical protein